MLPGIEVRTSSDHVNGENLIALARNSDVVVVQTSHATHAAFHAINAAVADRSQVILVHGRGASAIVRALLDSLTSQEADTAA
jgi:ribosome-interacting GTPase 1